MSLAESLYQYLTSEADLTGQAAKPFRNPQTVDGMVCNNRNDARRYLRNRIGKAIYKARRPQGSEHQALVIRRINTDREYHLQGEFGCPESNMEFTLFARGAAADRRNEITAALLRLALSSYSGPMGTTTKTHIGTIQILRESERPLPPPDGGDDWAAVYSFDAQIRHSDVAPEFSAEELTAEIGVTTSGTDIRLVAVGADAVAKIKWTIRQTETGPVLATWQGKPDGRSGSLFTTGLNKDQTFDAAAAGLSSPFYLTLELTDVAGDTATTSRLVSFNAGQGAP